MGSTNINYLARRMSKTTGLIVAISAGVTVTVFLQLKTIGALRQENARLRAELVERQKQNIGPSSSSGEEANPGAAQPAQKQLQELESEVMRLRGEVGRAKQTEGELAQLRAELERRSSLAVPSTVPEGNSTAERLGAYLGDAVAPPPNLDVAYTQEGLLNAIQQAARNAGVPLKRVEIEASEFPYLAGVVCEGEADFEKLKDQLKTMEGYVYHGGVSSPGCYAINITPPQAYPAGQGQRIGRRTTVRQQMFFDQLVARRN
jgi:hypothetical protein